MRSIAFTALLMAACSDDSVGRGNLPAHAGFRVTVAETGEARCQERADAWDGEFFSFDMLDSDAPRIFVPLLADPCQWESGSLLLCQSAGGDFAIDFAADRVSVTESIGGDPTACVTKLAIGEIVDLDAQ